MVGALEQSKTALIYWDTDIVVGPFVTVEGDNFVTQDHVPNTGRYNMNFPLDFVGDVNVTVTGLEGGTDTGTIHIDAST